VGAVHKSPDEGDRWKPTRNRRSGFGGLYIAAFGKPYLEGVGAIVAGIALGSLSMKTKSIYQGFLVHITVAALMDWLQGHGVLRGGRPA